MKQDLISTKINQKFSSKNFVQVKHFPTVLDGQYWWQGWNKHRSMAESYSSTWSNHYMLSRMDECTLCQGAAETLADCQIVKWNFKEGSLTQKLRKNPWTLYSPLPSVLPEFGGLQVRCSVHNQNTVHLALWYCGGFSRLLEGVGTAVKRSQKHSGLFKSMF